ncbi:MAG: hypothetical protein KBS59_07930, partial [Clostridiales bacterium]|nr:hypothetical protein [Clostridiales bacterium]
MKILGALIKTRLQALLSSFFGSGRTSAKVKKKKSKVGFIILAAYLIIVFLALFYMIFSQLAAAYCAAGLDWLYFTIFAIMSFGLMFVGSVFTAQTQLYEATDNEFLLSMPIPTKYILLSRMVSLGIFNLGYGLLVAIPAFFCYAIFGEVTFYKVVAFIVLLIAIVLFALAVTALFAWVIAAITGKMKSKTAFKLVLSLAFLGAYFVFYSKLWTYIETLAVTGEEVAEKVRNVEFMYFVGSGVGNGNIVHLLIVTAVFVAAFVLVYRVLAMRFTSIALKNRGASKKKYVATKAKNRGASSALLRKEFSRIGSSANYMMNCGLGVVFMIVVAVIAAVKKPGIYGFLDGIGIFSVKDVCVVFSFAICCMQSLIDFTAPSVSLEGPY